MTGEPFYKEGWAHVWAGARATYGIATGKVSYCLWACPRTEKKVCFITLCSSLAKAYFEVKLLEKMDAKVDGETNIHDIRVGWSSDDTSFQLGESEFSFCASSGGMKGSGNQFESYGTSFSVGDVVGTSLDIAARSITISFFVNGESKGEAFTLNKTELQNKALFPHVSTRNLKFEVNFGIAKDGSDREAWFAPPRGFPFLANVDEEQRLPGMKRYAKVMSQTESRCWQRSIDSLLLHS